MAQFEKQSADNTLSIYSVTGKVTSDEMIAELNKIFAMGLTENFLWDFSKADLSGLTGEHFRQIILQGKKHANLRPVGKTAFVVSSDLGYGLGRMYGIMSQVDDHPISYNVFRNINDAMDWINNKGTHERQQHGT